MIATLQFTLPDEQESFSEACDGTRWHAAMLDVLQELRNRIKHEELTEEQHTTLDEVRDMILTVLDDHSLRFE